VRARATAAVRKVLAWSELWDAREMREAREARRATAIPEIIVAHAGMRGMRE